jgi:hypothetical protein
MALPIKGGVVNQAVDQAMVAVHSGVVPKMVDLAKEAREGKVGREDRIAVKPIKYIMASRHLSLRTHKAQVMGPKEAHQKGENPSTKVLGSLVTLAKPSDF